jgi:coproporphyrinogen III oxidase
MTLQDKQSLAGNWFRALRDQICGEFEKIEAEYGIEEMKKWRNEEQKDSSIPQFLDSSIPSFIRTPWSREQGGGGEMSVMKGQVFEKVGVNISTVHGEFSETMRKEVPGAADMPHFWASGISLVAHMRSPLVPAVHMNTRMIVIGNEELKNWRNEEKEKDFLSSDSSIPQFPNSSIPRTWFGGGSDLTPMFPNDADTIDFHAAFKAACDRFDPAYYEKFKAWCDEYFFLKHRNEPRGVGGIFYDYVNSGDWNRDFEFTQEVGKTFAAIYPKLVRRHMHAPWTSEQREHQLLRRGRYVEFNLLYDRGTRFGLQTGGNVEAILMSMPPEAKWP